MCTRARACCVRTVLEKHVLLIYRTFRYYAGVGANEFGASTTATLITKQGFHRLCDDFQVDPRLSIHKAVLTPSISHVPPLLSLPSPYRYTWPRLWISSLTHQ